MNFNTALIQWMLVYFTLYLVSSVYAQECLGLPGEQRCGNGFECYQEYKRCNGESECLDDTDEIGCLPADCPWDRASKIKYCHSKLRCINTRNEDCHCEPSCGSGSKCCSDGSRCFTDDQRCDGKNHCVNGFDEERCWEHSHKSASSSSSSSSAMTVSIIGGIVVLVIIVVVVIVCVVCIRQRQTRGVTLQGTGMQPVVTGHYPQQIQQQQQQQQQPQTTVCVPQTPSAPTAGIPSEQGAPPPSYDEVLSKQY